MLDSARPALTLPPTRSVAIIPVGLSTGGRLARLSRTPTALLQVLYWLAVQPLDIFRSDPTRGELLAASSPHQCFWFCFCFCFCFCFYTGVVKRVRF
jgi:hypothetical protein